MFARISAVILYAVATFALLAAASPQGPWATATVTVTAVTITAPATTVTEPASQCNTGPVQCCDTVEKPEASDEAVELLLGLLGIVLDVLDVLVGVTCSPISIAGIGSGATCSQQAVCCENNDFVYNGLIGCVPVNIYL